MSHLVIRYLTRISALVLAIGSTSAVAQSFDDALQIEVLPGWREADGTHIAGLRMDLGEGWKTYWRVPGDGGIPPSLNFSGSSNVAAVGSHWPVPEVFHQNGLRSVGYQEDFIVPLRVQPDQNGMMRLSGTIDVGVCLDICIPFQMSFDLTLPEVGSNDAGIRAALADRMLSAGEGQVGNVVCKTTPISDGLRLEASVEMPKHGSNEAAVIEAGNPSIWSSEPQLTRDADVVTIVADLVPPTLQPFALDRSAVRITLLSDGPAVDIRGCKGS